MKRKQMVNNVLAIVLLVSISGCALMTPPTQREQTAALGALSGGAAGALIGSFAGSAITGGLFGMPLGAIAGYYIGDQMRSRAVTEEAASKERATELARLREENERLKRQAVARSPSSETPSDKAPAATESAKSSQPAAERQPAPSVTESVSQSVLFEFNRTGLTPEAKRSLSPVVSILNGGSNQKVTIQGYTDSVGSDAYNQVLSQKRSESVKGFLVQSGVSADQITARGFGEANPVASNDTDEGRRLNRRVDVIVSEGERTAAAAARDP